MSVTFTGTLMCLLTENEAAAALRVLSMTLYLSQWKPKQRLNQRKHQETEGNNK